MNVRYSMSSYELNVIREEVRLAASALSDGRPADSLLFLADVVGRIDRAKVSDPRAVEACVSGLHGETR